jgi:predicted SAM-dependent methyltransferase
MNVGCGYDRREGYLNVDFQAVHKPDLVADVTSLPMLRSGSFDEILAQDVLEHFERAKTRPALQEWARLLAPGGILHVRVPSLFGMFELLALPQYREPAKAEEIIHLMYGTQAYNGDYHLAGFTAKTLDDHLRCAGLIVCEASILHGWLFDVRARKVDSLVDDGEFVQSAYFAVLGRPVDPAGLAHWVNELAEGRMTRAQVQARLLASEEARFMEHHPAYLLPYRQQLDSSMSERATSSIRTFIGALLDRLKALRRRSGH